VTSWMDMARLVRGQTLALREREFVEAARATGTKNFKVMTRQVVGQFETDPLPRGTWFPTRWGRSSCRRRS
jgi:ABC-type microcin C transport system permease subunit YejE